MMFWSCNFAFIKADHQWRISIGDWRTTKRRKKIISPLNYCFCRGCSSGSIYCLCHIYLTEHHLVITKVYKIIDYMRQQKHHHLFQIYHWYQISINCVIVKYIFWNPATPFSSSASQSSSTNGKMFTQWAALTLPFVLAFRMFPVFTWKFISHNVYWSR